MSKYMCAQNRAWHEVSSNGAPFRVLLLLPQGTLDHHAQRP